MCVIPVILIAQVMRFTFSLLQIAQGPEDGWILFNPIQTMSPVNRDAKHGTGNGEIPGIAKHINL